MSLLREIAQIARREWKLFLVLAALWYALLVAGPCQMAPDSRATTDGQPSPVPVSDNASKAG
ncbi:MAG: hypothetical protein C4290_12405 [Chloroflexota bacterium]